MADSSNRTYHRPITMTIENVTPMPDVKELPRETQLTFNLKGSRMAGIQLIMQIALQIAKGDFFAVTITGPG